MNYIVLSRFIKQFDKYSKSEQEVFNETLSSVKAYLETSSAPYGLRVKKLSAKIYEARINIRLRIVFYRDKDTVKFFCLGNHNDIAGCLKRLGSILWDE